MHLRSILFFSQCIILYNQYNFINALVGENVRAVTQGEHQYVVSISLINPDNPHPQKDHGCTGTLISLKDVLCAEHCVKDKNWNELQVIVGSIDLYRGTKFIPCWWMTYKQWVEFRHLSREFKTNDVAVIRLTESVERLCINPIALSTLTNEEYYGLEATIVGWGVTNTGELSSILQKVNVTVLTNLECEERVSSLEHRRISFHRRLFCTAGNPYALMHRGDSGGPLIYNHTLIAVNKGSCPMAHKIIHPDKVNLHFGIEYYRDFIIDVINNY